MTTPDCILDVGCQLGEGPVWRAHEGALWFVDIKQCRIHRFQVDTAEHRSWEAPAPPGFIAPTAAGGWIAGLKTGLHVFDPQDGAFRRLHEVEPADLDNRLNDALVDAAGRLWFGSMHDPEEAQSGALYRFDRHGLRRMDDGYCITNGPAVSPDSRTLYHTDTLQKTIWAFDLSDEGALSSKRPFVRIEDGAGYPDGPAVDSEGCVWTGLFGGWGVRRYSPAGALLDVVRFPVANVTKIAFGGPHLSTAYATTARKGLSAAERRSQPLAGGVFCFPLSVPGLPQHEVAHA